jgi:hypothetical protein
LGASYFYFKKCDEVSVSKYKSKWGMGGINATSIFFYNFILLAYISYGSNIILSFLQQFFFIQVCGEPAISLHSHYVSLVQWTTRLLHKGPRFKTPGGTSVKLGFSG